MLRISQFLVFLIITISIGVITLFVNYFVKGEKEIDENYNAHVKKIIAGAKKIDAEMFLIVKNLSKEFTQLGIVPNEKQLSNHKILQAFKYKPKDNGLAMLEAAENSQAALILENFLGGELNYLDENNLKNINGYKDLVIYHYVLDRIRKAF